MTGPARMDTRAALEKIKDEAGPRLAKKFYQIATVVSTGESWGVALDDKPLRTSARSPARTRLVVPLREIANAIAAEWNSQTGHINPVTMPMTRLGVSAIDQVEVDPGAVRDQIAEFAASDLVLYRAHEPAGLVALQRRHWDPILAWAARQSWCFEPVAGVVHHPQPAPALAAVRQALDGLSPLMLSALFSITSLTGSALIASAMANGALTGEAAWAAAHVDEDWQISRWGEDSDAKQLRENRAREFHAAVFVVEQLTAMLDKGTSGGAAHEGNSRTT
ncbi:MAG: ATP12 family chaperone protein [Alphaproteobacteria bacterium]